MFLIDQEPELNKRLTEDVCLDVMERTTKAIGRYSGRDEDFTVADMQAERDPWWAGIRPRWKGGCFIEDPMTDEHLFENEANLVYVQGQADWYQVSEIEEADAQAASDMEAFLNDVVIEAKINTTHLYDLACNMGRHSYGVLHCGWKQEYGKDYTPIARHKRSERLVQVDDSEVIQHPEDYDITEEIQETVIHDGLDCRVPYTGDVYFDSPAAQSFKQATRVIERFHYTEDDFLNGIDDFGFDRKEVKTILASQPSSQTRSFFSEYNEREGISGDDTWEVLMVTGNLPAMLDEGASRLKESVRRRDYQWMLCPGAQSVFKFAKSPYRKRPYVKFPFRGVPGRMIGHSVCNMLAPLQREATLAYRFRVDFRDVYMSSPMIVPAALYNDWASFRSYPGAAYPVEQPYTPDHFKPLPYNPAGYQAGIADWKDTISRADAYFSADARSPTQYGNRTATEMAQISSGADEKTDLILTNMHFGVEDLGEVILSHYQQFSGSEGIQKRIGGKTVSVSPEMLRKRFRIQATGSSENANPLMRIKKAMELAAFAMKDPILIQKFQSGDKTGAYFIDNYVYRALGVRNPQLIIGREPSAPPNSEYILEAMMSAVEQYAQSGDQTAQQLQGLLQNLIQQAQAGGAQAAGNAGPQQQGPKMSVSMNFKDAPPQIQGQIEQAMGFQPASQGPPQQQQPNPQTNGAGQPGVYAGNGVR